MSEFSYTFDKMLGMRSYIKLGLRIRGHYIHWFITEDQRHLEDAVPDVCKFVSLCWSKIFHGRPHDPDIMDPVAYKILLRMWKHKLPFNKYFPRFIKVMTTRLLLRGVYPDPPKMFIPSGDKTVRAFVYKKYPSAIDVEHMVFVKEVKELVLDYLEMGTRLGDDEGRVCRYLAEEFIMRGEEPPLQPLRRALGLSSRKAKFLSSFSKLEARRMLYQVREDVPYMFCEDHPVRVGPLEYTDDDIDNDSPEDFYREEEDEDT